MSKSRLLLILISLLIGGLITLATYLIKNQIDYHFCTDSANCFYYTRGYPLKYYQSKLPDTAYNSGGPKLETQTQIDQFERSYFGSHFYVFEFVKDMAIWSFIAAVILIAIRKIKL